MNGLPITIPTIPPPSVFVFYKGKMVKKCNEYELNDVRIQIKKNSLEGFTIREESDSKDIPIDKNGRLAEWPSVLDLMCNQLCQIF